MNYRRIMLCAAAVLLVPAVASAETLRLTYVDPAGDNEGQAPDVVKLVVIFDNVTGDFEITVTSTETNPFAPTDPYKLGIYVNLFNLEAGSTTQDPSFFSSISDFQLSATAASLNMLASIRASLLGNSAMKWQSAAPKAIRSALGNSDRLLASREVAGLSWAMISLQLATPLSLRSSPNLRPLG